MATFATVAEAIANFEKASTGSEVKTALIDLLDTLNSVGGNTTSLGGHEKSYYVLESDLSKHEEILVDLYLKYTTEPSDDEDVKRLVLKNKDFTDFFVKRILDKLRAINGNSKNKVDKDDESYIGNNIRDALNYLAETHNELRTAIQSKLEEPHEVKETDSFMDLAQRITEINYSEINVKPLEATENKEYEAQKEEGRYIEAFNPVNVKIQLKGETILATENNKDYTPSSGYDGIASITVQVPDSSLSGSGSGGSGGGIYSGGALQGSSGEPNLGPTTINANGEYKASQYGLDGFSEVHVEVDKYELPEDKTFTVKFIDRDGNVLDEQTDILPGSNVTYGGDPNPPVYNRSYNDDFWVFAGWDPEPINVLSDMNCYARYTNFYPSNEGNPIVQSYRYINKPIQGDAGGYGEWEDILKDGGQKANVGDVKLLKLNPVSGVSQPIVDGTYIRMMKVSGKSEGNSFAAGASGATSVWMSLEAISLTPDNLDWPNSRIRTYLNGSFLQEAIPDWLRPHIPKMEKWSLTSILAAPANFGNGPDSFTLTNGNRDKIPSLPSQIPGYTLSSTVDRIYLPSFHELNILSPNDGGEFSDKIYSLTNSKAHTKDHNKYSNEYKYPTGVYFGLIKNVASNLYWKGETYNEVFKYFSKQYKLAQSYRDILKNLGSAVANEPVNKVIRDMLPHISRTVTECQGVEERERYCKAWDQYDYTDHFSGYTPEPDNYPHANLEPPLDMHTILQTERLSYLPGTFQWLSSDWGEGCFPYMGIINAENTCGTLVRDILLTRASLTYNSNSNRWNDPTYNYQRGCTDPYGFIATSAAREAGVICFGLHSGTTND